NEKFKQIQEVWVFQDRSDIGSGLALAKKKLVTGNTSGEIYALDVNSGKKLWSFQTQGKIYATPAIWKDMVIAASSDSYIYGIDLRNGVQKWKIKTGKAVLGSPVVHKGIAYIGGSDGTFRAINIRSGKIKWSFEGLKGYISAKPLIYQNKIYFGTWGNEFYALDLNTGEAIWHWSNGASNRMLSPAACYPVGANNRIFIVAPDRYMTALDAARGTVIWRKKMDNYRVRESIGLSADRSMVYAKTMDGQLIGVSTKANDMRIVWQSSLQLPYELAPTAIEESNK